MTDIDHPKMAGSGELENDAAVVIKEKSETVSKPVGETVTPVKRHKRAHSRNKSISGRQDFIDEIANGNEYKTEVLEEKSEATENLLNAAEADRTNLSIDEADALPASLRYNALDFLCTIISVLTYVVDVVMDCVVAYYFYHLAVDHGIYHYWYFGLTVFTTFLFFR